MSLINVFLSIDNVMVSMQMNRADFMNKSIKGILNGKKTNWAELALRRARARQHPLNLAGKKTPDDVLRNVDDYEIEMVYEIKTGSGLMDFEKKSMVINDIQKPIGELLGEDQANLHVFFRRGPDIRCFIKQKSPTISEPEPEPEPEPEETMDQLIDRFVRLAEEPLPSTEERPFEEVMADLQSSTEVPSFRDLMLETRMTGAANPYVNEKEEHASEGGGKISKRRKSKRKKSKRRRSKTRRRSR